MASAAASPSRARRASRIGTWRSDSAIRSRPGCETVRYVREYGSRNDHWRSSVALRAARTIVAWKDALACDWSCASPRRAASRMRSSSSASCSSSSSVMRSAASRAASASSAARTGNASSSSSALKARTEQPRNGSWTTQPSCSRSRSASRTGACETPSSCAIRVSTSRAPGGYSCDTMRCRITSLICSRRFERVKGASVTGTR